MIKIIKPTWKLTDTGEFAKRFATAKSTRCQLLLVFTRASNEPSRCLKLYNHPEGPY